MAQLRLQNITKIFGGDVTAVKDLSLTVDSGEFVVLVGPSGCGKSTTLRLIAGLETPTAGELYIGARRADGLPARERGAAMIFQDDALYRHMTVRENMAFPLCARMPQREADEKVERAAALLGIGELLERRPGALSGGQRQRAAIGRAIVCSPQVLLMDEPLSGLDEQLRSRLRAELPDICRSVDAAVVYVTHDQTEAMTLGDRIAVMDAGRLLQAAPPREIYDRPADVFVAGFFGTPPMNFFDAVLEKTGEAYAVRLGGAAVALPQEQTAALARRGPDGGPLRLGVRPQDLRFAPAGGGDITGVVQIVERTGADAYIYFKGNGGVRAAARAGADTPVKTGDAVSFSINAARCHLFDPQTGRNLLCCGEDAG